MITLELNKMSQVERLQGIETLWSDLSQNETNVESPSWHGDVLTESTK